MKFAQEILDTTAMLARHPWVAEFRMIGSALYHDDPKDADFLILVNDPARQPDWMFGPGWANCADYGGATGWAAIRKGNVNIIVTGDRDWYEKAKLANEVCVALKLQNKQQRIVVYKVIRDGLCAKGAWA